MKASQAAQAVLLALHHGCHTGHVGHLQYTAVGGGWWRLVVALPVLCKECPISSVSEPFGSPL